MGKGPQKRPAVIDSRYSYSVLLFLLFSAAALLTGSDPLRAAQSQQPAASSPPSSPRALLDQYCVTCHNQRSKTAGITFDTTNIDNVADHAELWEKTLQKLRGGMMPPPGARRP